MLTAVEKRQIKQNILRYVAGIPSQLLLEGVDRSGKKIDKIDVRLDQGLCTVLIRPRDSLTEAFAVKASEVR